MKITISDLELWLKIGVPETERHAEQRVLVTLVLDCEEARAALTDRIDDTVNYEKIVRCTREAAQGERKTLEKLLSDIAEAIVIMKGVRGVLVKGKKFVLPGVKNVAIQWKKGDTSALEEKKSAKHAQFLREFMKIRWRKTNEDCVAFQRRVRQ